jgi:hypothetical protein
MLDVVLNNVIVGRFREAEQLDKTRNDALRAQMEAGFDALRSHVDARFESVDRHQASIRSDLTQIALAMGAQPRPQAG